MHRSLVTLTLALVLFSLVFAPRASACWPDPQPVQTVCGYVYRLIATPYGLAQQIPQQRYQIGLCRSGGGCSWVQSVHTDSGLEAFNFPWFFTDGSYNTYVYTLYAFSYYEYWGSSISPMASVNIFQKGQLDLIVNVSPRPLPPYTIYPNDGNTNVPNNYLVQWSSGLDSARRASYWPTTWEVWYKYWPFDGSEPGYWTLARSGMPCHDDGSGPDANGNCSTYVAGPQPPGYWRWFVRADMDVTQTLPTYWGGSVFYTDSPAAFFQQPY